MYSPDHEPADDGNWSASQFVGWTPASEPEPQGSPIVARADHDRAPGDVPADFSLHLSLPYACEAGLSGSPAPTRLASPPPACSGSGRFPCPGERIACFGIVRELGRGSFAHVYLAQQSDLADRHVALKVTRHPGAEPDHLARLQHAHIVPIHSVHRDLATGLHLICMPFLGGATLSRLLEMAGCPTGGHTTGSLHAALEEASLPRRSMEDLQALIPRREAPSSGPADGRPTARREPVPSRVANWLTRSLWWTSARTCPALTDSPGLPEVDSRPALRFLSGATQQEAALWITARLAEGLQHAHDRGVLHCDLKPSNVLISADGTPMLLDFNLSILRLPGGHPDGRADQALGGTLAYMAPEQLRALRDRTCEPERVAAVGFEADLYSLGLILFELAAGQNPFPVPPALGSLDDQLDQLTRQREAAPPSLRAVQPATTWALESILRKCLAPDPQERYRRAGDLAEDLSRLLDDQPLRHAPELSVREQITRWRRRHPRLVHTAATALAAIMPILALSLLGLVLSGRLAVSHKQLDRIAFEHAYRDGQLLLNTMLGSGENLDEGIAAADRALSLYGLAADSSGGAVPRLDLSTRALHPDLRSRLSELLQLRAHAVVLRGDARGNGWDARRESLRCLSVALQLDPAQGPALFEQRAAYLQDLGASREAATARAEARKRPARTASDFGRRGTMRLASRPPLLDAAENDLNRAVALDPRGFWAWFALGLCHLEQQRHEAAASDFAVCAALEPGFAWPRVNQGLALAAAGRLEEALLVYDQAVAHDTSLTQARINRGLTRLELGLERDAIADLDAAIEQGSQDPGVWAARAEALQRLGRGAEAEQAFRVALDRQPTRADIWIARGMSRVRHAPEDARLDFDRALDLDPRAARALLGLAYLDGPSDPAAALQLLDRALELEPSLLDAVEYRALIRARCADPRAEQDIDRLAAAPTARRLYNAACALALLHEANGTLRDAQRALDFLQRAIDRGVPPQRARLDPDLKSLSGSPRFERLVGDHSRAS